MGTRVNLVPSTNMEGSIYRHPSKDTYLGHRDVGSMSTDESPVVGSFPSVDIRPELPPVTEHSIDHLVGYVL